MSRNPVAGNAWKYNRVVKIENKKYRNDRKKFRVILKREYAI